MNIKYYMSFFVALVLFHMSYSQLPDCTLGIGGKDTQVIVQVFQLNEEQLTKMEAWIGELEVENKLLEDQIQKLLADHPQQSHEDLATLAKKYKVLKDQLVAVSKKYDQKLLTLFNERQYQRYIDLCNEAIRQPMKTLVPIQNDTIPRK